MTVVAKEKATPKPPAPQGEKTIANDTLKKYLKLKAKKAQIDNEMKAHKLTLTDFANKHRDDFEDNKLELRSGTLRFATKSIVVYDKKKFDIVSFVDQFSEMLKISFYTSMIKKALQDGRKNKQLKEHGIDIDTVESLEIE